MSRNYLKVAVGAVGLLFLPAMVSADIYTVTNNSSNTLTAGSLGYAIGQANGHTGPDVIQFNALSNSITVTATLDIKDRVEIIGNGNTVGGFGPLVMISLLNFATGSSGSTLTGLALVSSNTAVILNSDCNWLKGCAIGTDWANQTGRVNFTGVAGSGDFNLIGGSTPSERNVISGNTAMGIEARYCVGLQIQGNYIGPDSYGLGFVDNGTGVSNGQGVFLEYKGCGALIGGRSDLNQGNLISGNSTGITIVGNATGNSICGNIIGLTYNESSALANSTGVCLNGTWGNWIGLPQLNCGNIISGNSAQGILIKDYAGVHAHHNITQNNFIGLNSTNVSHGNGIGISLMDADCNLIGGRIGLSYDYERNIISGNLGDGMQILNISNGNTVSGNFIGLTSSGNLAAANGNCGIRIYGNSDANLIGGSNGATYNEGNFIAGHNAGDACGVYLECGNHNRIAGNIFGLSANYASSYPNTHAAIMLGKAGSSGTCTDNLVGGEPDSDRNYICGTGYGIHLTDADTFGNTVVGNWVNRKPTGIIPAASDRVACGILLDANTRGNFIGSPASHTGNLIVGTYCGVSVVANAGYPNTDANGIYGNTICAFSNTITGIGVLLSSTYANNNKSTPAISSGNACLLTGSSDTSDFIEVFKADRNGAYHGGSLKWVGSAMASAGAWSLVPSGVVAGDYVCALSSDSSNNTSMFSANILVFGNTPTRTRTPTFTVTPTVSPTMTVTPTLTASPTAGAPAANQTATFTSSPTNALAQIDMHGKRVLAFPNPARDRVTFVMHLEEKTDLRISVYNLGGERVALLSAELPAGPGQSLVWKTDQVAAGIYFARVEMQAKVVATLKVAITR